MNIQKLHATMDFADYIKQYAEDIEVLYDLFQSKMEQNKGKYIIGDKDLEKIRYSDIYVKLKESEFMEGLRTEAIITRKRLLINYTIAIISREILQKKS